MNYLIHTTLVHPSLCLQYLILLLTIATITTFILLLLLLFHYYHHYKTVATDKPLRASLFPGAAELTTYLLRLLNILWLSLCRINKFMFYFPRRLLRSPILVGHQASPEAYTSYASLSLKQQKRIITKATKRSTYKSTNQGATAKRKRRKFTFQPESGESSCQSSITAQKYPQIQGEKF
jgi:hypothetical protein